MSDPDLIEAARSGDQDTLRSLLGDGADVHTADDQGWTPLNYAAGRGDAAAVRLLLEHGADPTRTGRDLRTPLMIARAAGRNEVAAILTEAEKERGVWEDPRTTRPYCKAYHLRDLRAFDGWTEPEAPPAEAGGEATDESDGDADAEAPEALTDESIVYVHQDFTVTRSMWHDEDVIFDAVSQAWRDFCRGPLEFAIPEDLL